VTQNEVNANRAYEMVVKDFKKCRTQYCKVLMIWPDSGIFRPVGKKQNIFVLYGLKFWIPCFVVVTVQWICDFFITPTRKNSHLSEKNSQ
jgi:hypothetical protein